MPTAYVGNRAITTSAASLPANSTMVRPISLREAATIEAFGFTPGATSATAKVKGVLYSKDATTGRPGTLLATTPELTGVTIDTYTEIAFASGVALAAGDYYAGLHVGAAVSVRRYTRTNMDFYDATAPYSSSAPSPYDATATLSTSDYCFWLRYTDAGTLDAYTFGKTTAGTAGQATWPAGGTKRAIKFTLSEGASVERITALFSSAVSGTATAKAKAVIYADAGTAPGSLLGASVEKVAPPAHEPTDFWFAAPVLLPAGTYYLGLIADTGLYMMYDTGFDAPDNSDVYADGPSDPFGAVSAGSFGTMLYAPYTPTSVTPPAAMRVIVPVWIGL